LRRHHRSHHRARLAAAERRQPVKPQFEAAAPDLPQQRGNFVRPGIVDIANEAQGQMIVVRVDPAGARQAAAQHGEGLGQCGGDFQTGEQPRHFTTLELTSPVIAESRR
jgi:hypothetical protein